jgi:hypothetical protein
MTVTMEKPKIKINFDEPHITYRLKNGQVVVGTTTAINKLDKPALPMWGFNVGREPRFDNIPEACKCLATDLETMTKEEAVSWAFSAGNMRKSDSLYGGRDKAANIGTIAHEILHQREKGFEIDHSNIQDEIWKLALGCVESHDKWFEGQNIETVLFEKDFVSEQYLYGGTLDKLAFINGELTLIDYKTGKDLYETNFIQLIAYVNLALEQLFNGKQLYPVKRGIAVNMPKTKGNSFAIKSVPVETLFEAGYFKWFLSSRDAYYAEEQTKKFKKVI